MGRMIDPSRWLERRFINVTSYLLEIEELFDLPEADDVSPPGLGLHWILGVLLVLEADEVLQQLLGVAVKVLGQDVVAITEIKVFF